MNPLLISFAAEDPVRPDFWSQGTGEYLLLQT